MINQGVTAPDREAFEEWYDAQPDGRIQPWDVWQAATAAERERCAAICDAIAHDWRGANSQSVQCANAIREGE